MQSVSRHVNGYIWTYPHREHPRWCPWIPVRAIPPWTPWCSWPTWSISCLTNAFPCTPSVSRGSPGCLLAPPFPCHSPARCRTWGTTAPASPPRTCHRQKWKGHWRHQQPPCVNHVEERNLFLPNLNHRVVGVAHGCKDKWWLIDVERQRRLTHKALCKTKKLKKEFVMWWLWEIFCIFVF